MACMNRAYAIILSRSLQRVVAVCLLLTNILKDIFLSFLHFEEMGGRMVPIRTEDESLNKLITQLLIRADRVWFEIEEPT